MEVNLAFRRKVRRASKGLWILWILWCGTLAVSANDQDEVFAALLGNLERIETSDFGKLPTVASKLQEIRAFARNLQQKSRDRDIPSNYLSQLALDAHALGMVAEAVSAKKHDVPRGSDPKHRHRIVSDSTPFPADTPTDEIPADGIPADRPPAHRIPTDRTPTHRIPTNRTPTHQIPTNPIPTHRIPAGRTSGTPSPRIRIDPSIRQRIAVPAATPQTIHLFNAFFLAPDTNRHGPVPIATKPQVFVGVVLGVDEKARLTQMLDDVRLDLSDKVSFAEKSPSDPFTSVKIKVTTRNRLKTEVSGYEVWFSPKVLFEDNHRDACFERPSSPTDCPLPAGNYVFWARRGSARGPIKQCKDVGIDGLTERSVDPLFTP
jgi:hypothetical protein